MSAPSGYNTLIFTEQGGAVGHVAPGGTLNIWGNLAIQAGAVFSVNGTASPANVTFSSAASTANVSLVTITVTDNSGATLPGVWGLDLWLSDAATGVGLTAVTASGAVAASSGTDVGVYTAKKALRVQTLATGIYVLSITDTGKTHFYVAASVPGAGRVAVSSQLATGSYG